MGNRAVITTAPFRKNKVGIYIHWNGGRDSVKPFLNYCRLKGYRGPVSDCYGIARLTQVIANFFGGELSIGVDLVKNLDCDNGDNGVYLVDDNWNIVGRKYFTGPEQNDYDHDTMIRSINSRQPEELSEEELQLEKET